MSVAVRVLPEEVNQCLGQSRCGSPTLSVAGAISGQGPERMNMEGGYVPLTTSALGVGSAQGSQTSCLKIKAMLSLLVLKPSELE